MTVIFVFAVSLTAHAAAKWETMTFTPDLEKDFSDLTQYCLAHEIAVKDVFWANHTEAEDIKAGATIYLPARQADLLAIWQHVGAWQPKALVPVTSGAAARRLIEPEQKAQPEIQVAQVQPVPASILPEPEKLITQTVKQNEPDKADVQTEKPAQVSAIQADANILPAPEKLIPPTSAALQTASLAQTPALSQENNTQTLPEKADVQISDTAPVQTSAPDKTAKHPETEQLIAQLRKPAPTPAVQTRTQQAAKQDRPSPAKAIAQMTKPDKILTAKPKPAKQELAGIMDPIIILSPNGDPTNGPMRLVISGDKVEVVKLPQSAAPKKPTVADANAPFTSSYSYLPYYNTLPKADNNNLMTNLNTLNGKMMWPVDGKISSPFGKWRGKHKHEGIDIPMPQGTPIRAARNGVVARTGNNTTMGFRGYGNFVMLDHGGNVKTFYAHCSKVAVAEGQKVMQGQIIGYVGSTGRSTANHLHFEVRINNAKVNPVPYLGGNAQLASHK